MRKRIDFLRWTIVPTIFVLCAGAALGQFDIDMVDVPTSTFLMGDPWSEGSADELPVHGVAVDPGFRIGRFEITNGEYASALNWAKISASSLPPEERFTDSGGGAYNGGALYVNGRLAIDLSHPACDILYDSVGPLGLFSARVRQDTGGNDLSMADHPTVMVTWWGALAFCNWQSRREGLPVAYDLTGFQTLDPDALSFNRSSAVGYRLPTEAEWEMAAAWDSSRGHPIADGHWRYGFPSDTASFAWANYYNGIDFNNPLSLAFAPYTSPVGFFDGVNAGRYGATNDAVTSAGCYDMSGNVAEWCQDWYHVDYTGAPATADPWEIPVGTERVLRGGSWVFGTDIRSAARLSDTPAAAPAPGFYGFRVAMNSATVAPTPTPTPVRPHLDSLTPSLTTDDSVIAGLTVRIAGVNFSSVDLENTVYLDNGSTVMNVSTSGANGTGTNVEFVVPAGILPALESDYPVSVDVLVDTNGTTSDNVLVLTINLKTVGLEFVRVPAGSFLMGDPWNEGNADERPVHEVEFDRDYLIGKYEITNHQFADRLNWAHQNYLLLPPEEQIANSTGGAYSGGPVYVNGRLAIDVDDSNHFCQIYFSSGEFLVEVRDGVSMIDHPVCMVTFYGALAFCNWQSRYDGMPPAYNAAGFQSNLSSALSFNPSSDVGYRLPSESEWERAAAWDPAHQAPTAGGHWRYAFVSDVIDFTRANYYDSVISTYCDPAGLLTQPFTSPAGFFNGDNVGSHDITYMSKSFHGCFDMSGNVYEWCQDNYHSSYSGAPADGSPWETSATTGRIVRGGAWNTDGALCRTANREWSGPYIRYHTIGFRIARSTDDVTDLSTSAENWTLYE
ncbi:SUMF1/EgtB/PvdO family nonheme iron enzyme [Candidatus Sumerlaeota bacterium]|nr:SUMF1/EgtB/PvdO family nonheme iron enzyme [Candidatus Sumerlaeota bacterium]